MIQNTGAEYFDAHETKLALYLSDKWQATDRLWLSGGVRLERYNVGGTNYMSTLAFGATDVAHPENERGVNWSIKQGTPTEFKASWWLPSFNLSARYTIAKGFGVMAEGIANATGSAALNFVGADMPNLDRIWTYSMAVLVSSTTPLG